MESARFITYKTSASAKGMGTIYPVDETCWIVKKGCHSSGYAVVLRDLSTYLVSSIHTLP